MPGRAEKSQDQQTRSHESVPVRQDGDSLSAAQFSDNRAEAHAQQALAEKANNSPQAMQMKTIQAKTANGQQAMQLQAAQNTIQRKAFLGVETKKEMTLKDVEDTGQSDTIKGILTGWVNDPVTDGRDFRDSVAAIKAAQVQMTSTHYDGTLLSLASMLKLGIAGASFYNDEFLLNVLKGPFEADWFKAKACLTMDAWPGVVTNAGQVPPHESSMNMMEALVEMRGRLWDSFAKDAVPKVKEAVAEKQAGIPGLKNAAKDSDNLAIGEAVGSQSVTSDIDLSLKGENTEIGVEVINTEFRKHFAVPYDPGTMFDINVYSADWMFGGTEIRGEAGVATYSPNAEATPSTPLAKQERADSNEVWSMVKIRRNMTEKEWLAYKESYLRTIFKENTPEGEAQYASTRKLFARVQMEHAVFRAAVHERLESMEEELEDGEAKLLDNKASAFDEGYAQEAREMRASNSIYQDVVLQVKQLRIRLAKLKAEEASAGHIDAVAKELADSIARALTFANEVYASEGAVLHTVYGKQGADKKKAKLNDPKNLAETSKFAGAKGDITAVKYTLQAEHYLQSVNENVGDSLHSLTHYANTPEYAAYRSGKYIDRLCEAASLLLGEDAAKTVANFGALNEIGQKAVVEKSGKAGEDPMAVKDEASFFSKFDSQSKIAEVKTKVIAFGADAAGKHKSKTARVT